MSAKQADIEIKLEGTEIQSYLESFNKEIDEGVDATSLDIEDAEGDEEDEDEEGGSYFVDQSGNYYYQANKNSEPVLTTAPDVEDLDDDSPEFVTEEDPIGTVEEGQDKDGVSYVLIMQDANDPKQEGIEEAEVEEENVYDFENADEFGDYTVEDDKSSISKVPVKKASASQSHMCNYCNYTSSKRYLLSRHMKSHSEDRPHKCSVCERGFKTLASLQNHVNTHTGTKPHRCKFCESAFTTSGELVRHVRYRHTHEKPHKCTECDYASVELSKLKRHIRCHTGERPYQCPHCTYASPDTFKLKRHLRIHTGEKPYECDVCHARFTQSNSLKAHKLIHSVGDKPVFHCELCPTTCGRKTDLRIHVQKLHTSDKPLKCKRCNKSYPDRYTYKMHTKTHEGEKCYKCDLCPYASISARHLESHILIHTDQKPYQCEQCEQSFRQKQLLKRHVNLYHNPEYVAPAPKEKTHQCPSCPRAFRHKGNLIRHMALHDPESSARLEAQALKVGRQQRIKVNGEDDLKEEDSTQDIVTVEGEDGQYVVLEVIQLQDEEEEHKHMITQTAAEMIGEGEVLDDEEEEEEEEEEEDEDVVDEFVLSGEEMSEDVLMSLGEQSKKVRREPTKMLNDDKDMSNCFGFDDEGDEDEDVEMEEEEEEDEKMAITHRRSSRSIKLLN